MKLASLFRRTPPTAPARAEPALEVKSLGAPEPQLWEIFGVAPVTAGGITVSTEQALRVTAVSCAIRTIAEAAASLDVMVKRVEADGTEAALPAHPVSRLLRGDVNGWTSGRELIADLVADALISDQGGVAYVARTGDGRVLEITRYRQIGRAHV